MGFLAITGKEDNLSVYVPCGQEIKNVSQDGEVKSLRFSQTTARKGGREDSDGPSEKDSQASGRVLGLCVSPSGRLVAAVNDRKVACVWRAEDGAALGSWVTARKASCLTFSKDDQALLVADKSGDVYKCELSKPESKPVLILGHISMVLDMCVTADGRRLVTCDRDEKIRITCYPNTWSIDAYCLGHSEFVAAVCLTPAGRLVSGGGDMTVRLWDPSTGQHLACSSVAEDESSSSEDSQKVAVTNVVAVETDGSCLLVVQVYNRSSLPVFAVGADSLTPLAPLRLAAAPWALAAAAGRLFVLRPNPAQPLAAFAADARGVLPDPLPADRLMAAAAGLWTQLKGTFEVPERVDWLFKQWFDNVSDYMSKKEERLKTGKKDVEESSPKRRRTSSE